MSEVQFIENIKEWPALLRAFSFDSFHVLADENTAAHCYPLMAPLLPDHRLITIPAGEAHKNLATCEAVWSALLEQGAGRSALLLNLGGGMVTDLGGFCASVYKRGIRFAHISTTLLGMVDAAIGGKTGVNFGHYKNQMGTFTEAQTILIWPQFLHTLPQEEFRSGMGEVLKYALIKDIALWKKLQHDPYADLPGIVRRCVEIKQDITGRDFLEKGERAMLNFGHTIGHALESFALERGLPLLHGEAVAWGMVAELHLSQERLGFPHEEKQAVTAWVETHFTTARAFPYHDEEILAYLRQDKKNVGSEWRFTLLRHIGEGEWGVPCTEEEVRSALHYLRETWRTSIL